MITPLPFRRNLDVEALSCIFKKTTNSYKYLLFQALLILIKEHTFEKKRFSFDELEKKILDIAKYPIEVCRLNFGAQDMVAECIRNPDAKSSLMRYVVHRLLTPFFENEIRGLHDARKNKVIEEASQKHSDEHAIYAISKDHIIIYSEWMDYFATHISVVEGWVFWNWVNYLQVKNPNVPSLVNKLERPKLRQSLTSQRKYWIKVLQQTSINCIFSDRKISSDNFSLDHFLPWSFVGHDQLWNLIPVDKSVNSSKSDNIPSIKSYFDRFIKVQNIGLEVAYRHSSKQQWKHWSDDFVIGLHLDDSDLEKPCHNTIQKKYNDTIPPLATIASNMGFRSNWTYR